MARVGRASASVVLCTAALAAGAACHGRVAERARDAGPRPERRVEIVPRTPHLAAYPCAEQCHDELTPDPTPRALAAFHAGRIVDHGEMRWCDACHAIDDLDRLTRMDGRTVSFDESDVLCAQCHGERHRDWVAGSHGALTGGWTGVVGRRTCTACHDPHVPSPIRLEALPPPHLDPRLGGHG